MSLDMPVGSAPWVEGLIHAFWGASAENSMGDGSGEKAWDAPLVGYARGDDPLFAQLKEDLGPFYWTPLEALRLAFPQRELRASELAVICWVLPQTAATRAEQRLEKELPAERWARSRDYGERFNCALRLHLAATLSAAGFPAVAPERLPQFAYRQSERFGLASNWSERHTAHFCGLGTFGLSDGLITRLGKSVRLGSVVACLDLPATPRPYKGHQEWCLYYRRGTCGACMRRCPVAAIDFTGHDKERCRSYIREVTAPYAQRQFGIEATPCGLCQVGIPCEARAPLLG
jgi:epoxyqueuosine reductase